eukprot:2614088-Amphidinium_carterae.1
MSTTSEVPEWIDCVKSCVVISVFGHTNSAGLPMLLGVSWSNPRGQASQAANPGCPDIALQCGRRSKRESLHSVPALMTSLSGTFCRPCSL